MKDASGKVVTRLIKTGVGCMKSCVSDSDNFHLGFPDDANEIDKALLLAATLFIDYMYFESKHRPGRPGIPME